MLEVRDLRAAYLGTSPEVEAVAGVSFSLERGESLGLVGESGSGKSTLVRSLLRVLGPSARISGSAALDGTDLISLHQSELRRIRGRRVALITQSAMNALDPVYRVGDQVVETLRAHLPLSLPEARRRAEDLFGMVDLNVSHLDSYPHQLSGGMRQRTVIAIALAAQPDLILADEPTTALDVVVQRSILRRLSELREELHGGMILVTHDVSVVAETCQRIAVMYAGKLVEVGPVHQVLDTPLHPYTMGLLNASPTLNGTGRSLVSIPGTPPDLAAPPPGCRFADRCPFATDLCHTDDPLPVDMGGGRTVACHHIDHAEEHRVAAADPATWGVPPVATYDRPAGRASTSATSEAVCSWEHVSKRFTQPRSVGEFLRRRPPRTVTAVSEVSLQIAPGEIVGVAGESGAGKSTLAEMMVALQQPSSGHVLYQGSPPEEAGRRFRRQVQMVFQDPYETLNPRFTVAQSVAEPLRNLRIGARHEMDERVRLALDRSGLSPADEYLDRYPHQLSGGERQRVAIARAVVTEPRLLVADEPVSMLDVSIRAGILNLFQRFRAESGLSVVYISHDLATIRSLCDRTAVMYAGRVVETGPTDELIDHPRHPYTELLVSAAPRLSRSSDRRQLHQSPDDPNDQGGATVTNGCAFRPRCPHAMAACGWEPRDLAVLLDRRREKVPETNQAEAELLAAIERVETVDLDLVVKTSRAEELAGLLERLAVEAGRQPMLEVAKFDADSRYLTVSFPPKDAPPSYDVAAGQQVACHLYAETTSPLTIRRTDKTEK